MLLFVDGDSEKFPGHHILHSILVDNLRSVRCRLTPDKGKKNGMSENAS